MTPRGTSHPPRGTSQPPRGGSQPSRGGSQPPRGTSQPPRGGSRIRIAAAWADDYRYILGVQLRSRLAAEPPADYLRGERSPVLLLPGIYESWYYLEPLARRLHELGHPVIAVPELGRNVTTLRASSAIVAERLRVAGTSDLVILAHSKGGLIGKALMLGPVAEHVRGMVAINTPFAGSSHARWFPGRSVRALSDRDQHVLRLSGRRDVNGRIVSIYPVFDPHVPAGSFLAGARNVQVDVVGHFRIIEHPEVRRAALAAVAEFST